MLDSDIVDQSTTKIIAEFAVEYFTINDAAKLSCENCFYKPIHIRLSSKHLTLASAVFKKMLEARFKKELKLISKGYVEIALPEDNATAFLILLNLIHGRMRKVPRNIDSRTLSEIVILVDRYELLEITEFWVKS